VQLIQVFTLNWYGTDTLSYVERLRCQPAVPSLLEAARFPSVRQRILDLRLGHLAMREEIFIKLEKVLGTLSRACVEMS